MQKAKWLSGEALQIAVKRSEKQKTLLEEIKEGIICQSNHFMGNRWETVETVSDFIFWGSKITAAMKLKDAYSLEGGL